MFLGLPDPDPLVRGMDPAPDPAPDSSLEFLTQNVSKKLNRLKMTYLWVSDKKKI
jgi:hypothetical protein